ncbi:uncharacterized protein PRCAT00005763001 [Priceomyces carsonii]|uniref:uncharacterized protein n=1 Tax=Priceomyces carsonii TaxID=28549 RepID=UPI002ED98509|nr:unnamed protein product [Priceomyces carsonii]
MLRLTNRSIVKQCASRVAFKRTLQSTPFYMTKNDNSTIDSYKLPSQSSINEWEFKYDFIPKTAEPKIPPVTPEAVKQDVAHQKKANIEKELSNKEQASSVKVEANAAQVVHGGESVGSEPEFIQDRGSKPIDASISVSSAKGKPANRDKYIQSSANPHINKNEVVNLGDNEVDHKTSSVEKQTQVVDDIEHDNLHTSEQSRQGPKKSSNSSAVGISLGLGVAGIAGFYYYTSSNDPKKADK